VKLLGALAPAAVLILIVAAPTAALAVEAPPLPQEFSAADQYVESVPTSSGPRPAKRGKRPKTARRIALPPPVAKRLDEPLREVATSPSLGAPERKLRRTDAPVESPSVPSATVTAVDEAHRGRLLWLLLALLLVTGALVGTAGYRHKARRRTLGGS
jgi:Tfp pilus assembly protein FimV